jgi:hypothetical protein
MTWFAFAGLNGGKAIDLAGSQEKQAVAEGFHGYGTEAQAEAHPNALNPLTRLLADGWIADYHAAVSEGAQPGGPNASILNPKDALGAALAGGWHLSFGNTSGLLGRALKVGIGLVLIVIGLNELAGGKVTAAAGKMAGGFGMTGGV